MNSLRAVPRAMDLRHRLIIGQTGTGKSTYAEHDAINNNSGWAFIDPHGPTALRLGDFLDVIYFDPTITPLTLNVLENVSHTERSKVAWEIVDTLEAIWPASWGERMAWLLYNCVRLTLDNNGTLTDIYRVLTDTRLRTRWRKRASFKEFWDDEFDAWSDKDRTLFSEPILNKLGRFTADPILSTIFGSKHSTLNISRVLERGDRLVVNLDKSKLGPETTALTGALLVSAFARAAFQRPISAQPYYLYIDEFHSFATKHFDFILSETRKYSLFLTLIGQYLAQLDAKGLREAVFGNVYDITAFRVGAQDAQYLATQLDLSPRTLQDLPDYRARRQKPPAPSNAREVHSQPPLSSNGRLTPNIKHTKANYLRA
jgi:hypothetical protein